MLLFLDIDGVMNDHGQSMPIHNGIQETPVRYLNKIINHTGCAVVISSAWRYMILRGAMTELGFYYMMKTHGVNDLRIHGVTASDEDIPRREDQIRDYVDRHNPTNWAVLDDLPLWGNKHPNFVQTDGHVGLTKKEADLVIRILNGRTQQNNM